MERLSHDLNLALEESNCGKQGRRKLGLRRRTRSAGNLPAACIAAVEDGGSSSSPPQQPIISQPLSDSDDAQFNQIKQTGSKSRTPHFCHGNFESDSFNENFSPTRPPNARRKRKYKKMAVDYTDSNRPVSPVEILNVIEDDVQITQIINNQATTVSLINKKKRIFKQERTNAFCGKRKWSHRERSEIGEMRERSFSGGCASKSYFFGKNYLDFKNKKFSIDKVPKFKEKLLMNPCKMLLKQNTDVGPKLDFQNTFSAGGSGPVASSFNFVYKSPSLKNGTPILSKLTGFKIATNLPPFFANNNPQPSTSSGVSQPFSYSNKHHRKQTSHSQKFTLRNPLHFVEGNSGMDCSLGNEILSSSSLSSSDSEGVVTNDSDREGDDELTDWPGNDEISAFSKNLNLKSSRPSNGSVKQATVTVNNKPAKKDKYTPKHGHTSCKNKLEKLPLNAVEVCTEVSGDIQVMDDDTMMCDSGTPLDTTDSATTVGTMSIVGRGDTSFTSFGDVKKAGLHNQYANEDFYHSFATFQEKSNQPADTKQYISGTLRSNFSLQKTSSSDLNLSEKSPQSDHYCSEHSLCNMGTTEIREIRAGCRRIRDERPGFSILSAANEQLSKFLQDSCQQELKLPCFRDDPEERDKLESLAKLYSLQLQVEMGRPILKKTSNTTQAIRVEQSRMHHAIFFSDYKRRCYGDGDATQMPFPCHDDAVSRELGGIPNLSISGHGAMDSNNLGAINNNLEPGIASSLSHIQDTEDIN